MVILIYYIYYTSQARLAWLCVLFCLDICECDCDRTVAFTWPSAVLGWICAPPRYVTLLMVCLSFFLDRSYWV